MKEQKVFDVTIVQVTENLHEASGIVQGVERDVLVDRKFTAVNEESAKQKAIKESGAKDFDSLEITCSLF